MKIRAFAAIELPSLIQDAIVWQTTNLRKLYPNPVIRWVKPGNIHLTLKFLGDLTKTDLELLARSIAYEALQLETFSISFSNLGVFPNTRKPRVIWIGVNTPAILGEFQSRIEILSSRLGVQIGKRPFSPHITLGRIGNSNFIQNYENMIVELGSTIVSNIDTVDISAIEIFKSDLKPDGPIYTTIYNIPFGNTKNQRGEI